MSSTKGDSRARAFAEGRERFSDKCGVHTVEDLKGRCVVDEETGCWHWKGGCDGDGRPALRVPALGNKQTTLGVAICALMTGRGPRPGKVWHCTCETKNCANPRHRKEGTRSTQMKAAKLGGDPARAARIASGKRRASTICTPEMAADIRTSTDTTAEIARRLELPYQYVWRIRKGHIWRETLAPASVFSLGAA